MAGADRMTIEEVVRKVLLDEHADVIREAVKAVAAQLMEIEVTELIGAEHGERRPEDRATHRNGYRPRRWDTRAGEIELQIPKIRQGSYFPSILEPRRRSEQALLAVVQQAYVCGVSTRRVDQLVESLGLRISKSEVSRVCGALDEHVEAFRTRPLEGRYPYLFLDAKVEKVRDGGRVVNKALVIAHGVHETGRREILGARRRRGRDRGVLDRFLRGLVKRGLVGVQLAISDAHAGLKAAIAKVLGCAWQRCTVHFLRDCLGHARKDQHGLLGGADPADLQRRLARPGARPALRSGRASRRPARQGRDDARGRRARHPRLLRVPELALAQAALDEPARALQQGDRPAHRRRRHLPRRPLLIRLAGMLCIEQNDEWFVGRGYLSAESISLVLAGPDDHTDNEINEEVPELQAA